MANDDESTQRIDPLSMWSEIDVACDSFESMWHEGNRPDISSFVATVGAAAVSTLFLELVKVDIFYRTKIGEKPSVSDYAERFPEYSDELSLIDPALPSGPGKLRRLKQVGNLQLIEQLGTGSFGTVWKAIDVQHDRIVAVKLPNERNSTREHAADFQREAKAAGHQAESSTDVEIRRRR